MRQAMQLIQKVKDNKEAEMVLEGLRLLDGYIVGRILEPCNVIDKDYYRVQALFNCAEITDHKLLPEGCRLVVITDNIIKLFA